MAHEAKLANIGFLEVAGEASAFGTEGTNYEYVRTMPIDRGSVVPTTFRDESQRQNDVELEKIIGAHNGSLSVSSYLHGFSSSTPSGAPTHIGSHHADSNGFDMILDILAGAIGNIHSGGHTTAEAGSTTSIIKANGTTLVNGQFIGWLDSSGNVHVNTVKSQDLGPNPDEFTLTQTATAVPASSTVFGAHTIFQATGSPFFEGTVSDTNPGGASTITTKGFSLRYTGMNADDRDVYLGCWPSSLNIEMNVNELPMLNLEFLISHWRNDALPTDLGIHSGVNSDNGGVGASKAWSFPTCEAVTNAHISWGGSQANTRQVQGISLDMGLEVSVIKDPNAKSGIGGYFIAKRTPKITATLMRDVSEEIHDFFGQDAKTLTVWAGSGFGKICAMQMGAARIDEYPTPSDVDGALMTTVTWVANEYTSDGGDITSQALPGDKQFKLGFL